MRFLLPAISGLVLMTSLLPGSVRSQSLVDTPFTRQVLTNFSAWDTDKDGTLSYREINGRVADPRVAGEAAAALAALKIAFRSSGNTSLPPFTRDYFSLYARGVSSRKAPPTRAAEDEIEPHDESPVTVVSPAESPPLPKFDSFYRRGLVQIRTTGPEVFLANDPRLDHVKQRHASDCFFLAVIGAMISRDPARVRRMIVSRRDGSYTVTFPGKSPVSVPALTDAQLCLYGSTSSGARWLMILEEGFGRASNETWPERVRHEVASDYYVSGGNSNACLRMMTGNPTNSILLRESGADALSTQEESAPKLAEVRQALGDAFREQRLVTAGTNMAKRPPAITGRHSYAVIGYDPTSDTVRMWNPHRNNFRPRGASGASGTSGITSGYATREGLFNVPLEDFVRVFARLSWEAR